MLANELINGHQLQRAWTIITEDLDLKKIFVKRALCLLNKDEMERRVQVCHDILERLKTEPDLLRKVVTGDES